MIKDIVTFLPDSAPDDPAAGYAASLAATFKAHLTGIALAFEPEIPPTSGPAVRVFLEQRKDHQTTAQATAARLDDLMKRDGLSGETRVLATTVRGASSLVGGIARRFDIAVIGQAQPERPMPSQAIIEGALFESGRPVLVVPYIQKTGFRTDRVMVCWDASRAAARALADAMPLLRGAQAVDVVIVAGESHKSDRVPGTDVAQHLARHVPHVTVEHITADIDIAAALLNYVADRSVDLIVMGGYGHSRMRELILGGTTRTMLHSMTAPTLMSH